MALRRSRAALAKRCWRALRLPWQRRGKGSLRKNLPGIDDRNGQGRCNNQVAKHQGVSPSRTMESDNVCRAKA
jgi:hypothetical protein